MPLLSAITPSYHGSFSHSSDSLLSVAMAALDPAEAGDGSLNLQMKHEEHEGHEEHDEQADQQGAQQDNEGRRRKKNTNKHKVTQARWGSDEVRGALAYLDSHTAVIPSGCRLWDKAKQQTVNFRGVIYPSAPLLAFAAHHPEVRLEHGMGVETKCGNELCVARNCLVLTFESKRGPKGANFQALSQTGRTLLQSQARANGKLGELCTRSITVAELMRLNEESNYDAIQEWLHSSHDD
jgi:hypothetical protein